MRLWDRWTATRSGYWEGLASGAAVLTTTYGQPNREASPPGLAGIAQQAYMTNPIVSAAVDTRRALFSEVRFQLRRAPDKKLFGDPRLRMLEQPWPDGTAGDLLAVMQLDRIQAGNAFIWDAADQLVRWRPDWVTIISEIVQGPRGPYRKKVGFHFEPPKDQQPAYGPPQTVPVGEVAHWAPDLDPCASFRGKSKLAAVLRDIAGDDGLTKYKIRYLENSASPNLLIKYAAKLQDGTVDKIRERMTARYGGVDNAFKTLVLDQGADVTVIGNSLTQMDFSGVSQAGAERILAALDVPGVLVGLEPLRGAGRGYEESLQKFANLWARPEWRSVCGCLQKFITGNDVDAGAVWLWFDTADVTALQEGEQAKAQIGLIHAQTALTYAQAGFTQDSILKALSTGDVTQLEGGAQPVQLGAGQSQHMLPQAPGSGPLPGLKPLPQGSVPRLTAGSVSPGDGGNGTRPGRRPASVRRP